MALPYPGMDFVPFDILTAQELDQIVSNIQSLSNGTGFVLNNNVIPGNALSNSAITLGYAQITNNFVINTSQQPVTGLSVPVTVPTGNRKVKITVYTPTQSTSGANIYASIQIWDGAVGSGTLLNSSNTLYVGANYTYTVTTMAVVTPPAGAKTYTVGCVLTGSSNPFVNITGSNNSPAFIHVEGV